MINFVTTNIFETANAIENEKNGIKSARGYIYDQRKAIEEEIEAVRRYLYDLRKKLVQQRDAARRAASEASAAASNARDTANREHSCASNSETDEGRAFHNEAASCASRRADALSAQASASRSQADALTGKIMKVDSRISQLDHVKGQFISSANSADGSLAYCWNRIDYLANQARAAYNAVQGTFHSCSLDRIDDLEIMKKDLESLIYRFNELADRVDSGLDSLNSAVAGANWIDSITKDVRENSHNVADGQYGMKDKVKQLERYIQALQDYLSIRV